ncbi:MAG: hypothetical protein QXW10_03310 [Candidatus Micrarchaeaceae archaeon]
MEYKAFFAFAVLALLLTGSMFGILSSIINFFESLFHAGAAISAAHYPAQLTIYFSNPHQFIIGLGNFTTINKTNTTVRLENGFYSFDIGSVSVTNNIAYAKLYTYNLSIINTTAIISVKGNDTVQFLNIGNGTFSVSLSKPLVNQS